MGQTAQNVKAVGMSIIKAGYTCYLVDMPPKCGDLPGTVAVHSMSMAVSPRGFIGKAVDVVPSCLIVEPGSPIKCVKVIKSMVVLP